MKAVICGQCGSKVAARGKRCPRCRGSIAGPDPAIAAAASRRMRQVAAGLAGAFVLVTGVLWLRSESVAPVVRPAGAVLDPMAGRRAEPPPPAAAIEQPAAAPRKFMDASAVGASAYAAGDYEGSLAQFETAVERNPQDAESLSNLGQVLVRLNRAEEALPYFDRAIAIIPSRWTYQFNRAKALGTLGRWDEAIEGYRRAQAIFPEDYATAFNLGMALHKKGDEAGAVEAYQKAIALEPTDPSFRMALAISYERLQKPAEAAAAYGEALKLSPDAPDADRVRARIAQLTAPATPPGAAAAPAGPGGR
jgi:Flp pilus assembly protein TadD